jgi:hypothetical protein
MRDAVCKVRLRARNASGSHEFAASEADFEIITSYFGPPQGACRKLWRRPQDGQWRPSFQTLLTFGRPKQTASSRFCSHTVQAPAKSKPLRSHTLSQNLPNIVRIVSSIWLLWIKRSTGFQKRNPTKINDSERSSRASGRADSFRRVAVTQVTKEQSVLGLSNRDSYRKRITPGR